MFHVPALQIPALELKPCSIITIVNSQAEKAAVKKQSLSWEVKKKHNLTIHIQLHTSNPLGKEEDMDDGQHFGCRHCSVFQIWLLIWAERSNCCCLTLKSRSPAWGNDCSFWFFLSFYLKQAWPEAVSVLVVSVHLSLFLWALYFQKFYRELPSYPTHLDYMMK